MLRFKSGRGAGSRRLGRKIAMTQYRLGITSAIVSSPCPNCNRIAEEQNVKPPHRRMFAFVDVGRRPPNFRCLTCDHVHSTRDRAAHNGRQPYELVPLLRREQPVRRHICGDRCPKSGRCENYKWVYVKGELPPGVVPHNARMTRNKDGTVTVRMPKSRAIDSAKVDNSPITAME